MLCACVLKCFSHFQLFVTLWTIAHQALLSSWDSPGKNTGVGCHALLQGILLTWDQNQVSCISCTAGSFFTAELPRSLYIIIVYKFWYYINLAYTRPCLITSVKITSPTLNKYILNKIKVSFSWKSAILTVMWSEFQN